MATIHPIFAGYLFGSRASRRVRRESDPDLAILQDGEGFSEKKLDILAPLAAEGFCDVDLVSLPKDNIVLQYEATRMNHVVCQRPDFDRRSSYSLAVRQYLGFLPFLEVQRKAPLDIGIHEPP